MLVCNVCIIQLHKAVAKTHKTRSDKFDGAVSDYYLRSMAYIIICFDPIPYREAVPSHSQSNVVVCLYVLLSKTTPLIIYTNM